jgi:catechol 2,3-dioxygenase-like lactoylglutathione lyase family enzyme
VRMIQSVWSITLSVSNLGKAVVFYEETLGLTKKYEYSSYAGFQCGGVEIDLSTGRKEKGRLEDAPSVEFIVDDVDVAYKTLKRKGVKFVKEPHDEPWGGRESSFLDPDGNLLEIVQIDWKRYFEVSMKGVKAP